MDRTQSKQKTTLNESIAWLSLDGIAIYTSSYFCQILFWFAVRVLVKRISRKRQEEKCNMSNDISMMTSLSDVIDSEMNHQRYIFEDG